jgi:hypothetical protein
VRSEVRSGRARQTSSTRAPCANSWYVIRAMPLSSWSSPDRSSPSSVRRQHQPAGGASAQPANAGTVTRADGTFELTGIPPGSFSITVAAGGHHPRIEGGLVAAEAARVAAQLGVGR